MINTALKKSMDEKKGITLYLHGGQKISLIVSQIKNDKTIEGYNQEHDYIVVSAGEIAAAAI